MVLQLIGERHCLLGRHRATERVKLGVKQGIADAISKLCLCAPGGKLVVEISEDIRRQQDLCHRYGTEFVPAPAHMKVGIAYNVREGILPINGLRHPVAGDTTGWYIWAGEELSDDPGFFLPLHVEHLAEWCPDALPPFSALIHHHICR